METLSAIAWTTVDSESAAESLARELIQRGLAACVQVDEPVQSIYKWEGAVQSGREWRLMIKFSAAQNEQLNMFIVA